VRRQVANTLVSYIYIVDNNKLNAINRDTIALNKILLNNITIIFNLINTLYISKLLIVFLSINILTKREINVNFYNNKYRIIVFNNN